MDPTAARVNAEPSTLSQIGTFIKDNKWKIAAIIAGIAIIALAITPPGAILAAHVAVLGLSGSFIVTAGGIALGGLLFAATALMFTRDIENNSIAEKKKVAAKAKAEADAKAIKEAQDKVQEEARQLDLKNKAQEDAKAKAAKEAQERAQQEARAQEKAKRAKEQADRVTVNSATTNAALSIRETLANFNKESIVTGKNTSTKTLTAQRKEEEEVFKLMPLSYQFETLGNKLDTLIKASVSNPAQLVARNKGMERILAEMNVIKPQLEAQMVEETTNRTLQSLRVGRESFTQAQYATIKEAPAATPSPQVEINPSKTEERKEKKAAINSLPLEEKMIALGNKLDPLMKGIQNPKSTTQQIVAFKKGMEKIVNEMKAIQIQLEAQKV
jgi:hypothetical protein